MQIILKYKTLDEVGLHSQTQLCQHAIGSDLWQGCAAQHAMWLCMVLCLRPDQASDLHLLSAQVLERANANEYGLASGAWQLRSELYLKSTRGILEPECRPAVHATCCVRASASYHHHAVVLIAILR